MKGYCEGSDVSDVGFVSWSGDENEKSGDESEMSGDDASEKNVRDCLYRDLDDVSVKNVSFLSVLRSGSVTWNNSEHAS